MHIYLNGAFLRIILYIPNPLPSFFSIIDRSLVTNEENSKWFQALVMCHTLLQENRRIASENTGEHDGSAVFYYQPTHAPDLDRILKSLEVPRTRI